MTITPVGSSTFSFADGNGGHACDTGSAPSVGQTDVLCVNSDTVVSTPGGFTAGVSAVANQGSYIFYRIAAGGESAVITVTTSGNHDTQVSWSRWAALAAADAAANTQVNASVGGATPTHSTGTLAAAGELVVAFGALHSVQSANQTAPAWSAGFTGLTNAVQGSGASGVRGLVGYKIGAGTAAEAPQVSWTGDGCFDRYALTLTFTAAPGQSVALGLASEVDSAIALGRRKARALGLASEAGVALPLVAKKSRAIGTALEADVALPLAAALSVARGSGFRYVQRSPTGRYSQ